MKKIKIIEDLSQLADPENNHVFFKPDLVNKAPILIISSPHAWKAIDLELSPSILWMENDVEKGKIDKKLQTLEEISYVLGVGSGKIMDISKYCAHSLKKPCILVPSILSTTAWLNPTASLKNGPKVIHEKGNITSILISPSFISQAPSHLNLGGLADVFCMMNAWHDWELAKNNKKAFIPKSAREHILEFFSHYIDEFPSTIQYSVKTVIQQFSMMLEGMVLCYGLLSGRPLEGSEHLLYYAQEENLTELPPHGKIIALNTCFCMILHQLDSVLESERYEQYLQIISTKHVNRDFDFLFERFRAWKLLGHDSGLTSEFAKKIVKIVHNMPHFVLEKKYPYSIWNQSDNLISDIQSEKILNMLLDINSD